MSAGTAVRRSVSALVVAVTALAATSWGSHTSRDLDVAAIAIASADQPSVDDEEVEVARLGGRSSAVQGDVTATSDCDGRATG